MKSEDKPREKQKRRFRYINTSKQNIFTEHGRCMPGESIELFVDEAKKFPDLEKQR
mgnify:CR=1 FL=1